MKNGIRFHSIISPFGNGATVFPFPEIPVFIRHYFAYVMEVIGVSTIQIRIIIRHLRFPWPDIIKRTPSYPVNIRNTRSLTGFKRYFNRFFWIPTAFAVIRSPFFGFLNTFYSFFFRVKTTIKGQRECSYHPLGSIAIKNSIVLI